MHPSEVAAQGSDLQFLDVREHDEWAAGHVTGSVHIPMAQLPSRVTELDTSRPILAICRSGARSGRVTTWLEAQGYEVHNLEGGLKAWHAEGLPLETTDGRPGAVA